MKSKEKIPGWMYFLLLLFVFLFLIYCVGFYKTKSDLDKAKSDLEACQNAENWTLVGNGLTSISLSEPDDWGVKINITEETGTLTTAQAWVRKQGGVSLNYPIHSCIAASEVRTEDCIDHFYWSNGSFTQPTQLNANWKSFSYKTVK